jgi:tRNA modification GTPase
MTTSSKPKSQPTIAAIATPAGRGGVGIIRVSGSQVANVAQKLFGQLPPPRYAHYTTFHTADGVALDQGLALYFPNPHSFTGEDVLELHTHGSPQVLDLMLKRLLELDVALARPGEFSERAFLNGKLDLVQAEAIADLIDAASAQAARSALRSLQGEFSRHIHVVVNALIDLRVYVEAWLDFPEEDINFLGDQYVQHAIDTIATTLVTIEQSAQQGALLRDGMRVVIVGSPNVGKSSLLNQLSGQETAIVTDVPGTTRDVLRERIHIDGLPLHIIDTAGMRESDDIVEREGMRRTEREIADADRILLLLDVLDATDSDDPTSALQLFTLPLPLEKLTIIYNKIDLLQQPPRIETHEHGDCAIYLSAKTGAGIDVLRAHLKHCLGFDSHAEGAFIARRRHLDALARAAQHLTHAKTQLHANTAELLAEELRLMQQALSEITGQFLPDDLLGEIFSRFCIGK